MSLFEIGFILILFIGIYLAIGLIIALWLAREDHRLYGDNRWLLADLNCALFWGLGAAGELQKFKKWYYSARQRQLRSIQTKNIKNT